MAKPYSKGEPLKMIWVTKEVKQKFDRLFESFKAKIERERELGIRNDYIDGRRKKISHSYFVEYLLSLYEDIENIEISEHPENEEEEVDVGEGVS